MKFKPERDFATVSSQQTVSADLGGGDVSLADATAGACDDALPESVDAVVTALCADFWRRASSIEEGRSRRSTDAEHRYLNYKITAAATEAVGGYEAEFFIREIGEKVGYAKSEMTWISEATYKKRKRAVKVCIAKKLHLID